jgi:hypothetical protein
VQPVSPFALAPPLARADLALRHVGRGEAGLLGVAVRVEVLQRTLAEQPEAGAAAPPPSRRDAVIDVQARSLEPAQLALQAPTQAPPLSGSPSREALARRAIAAYRRGGEERKSGVVRSVRA